MVGDGERRFRPLEEAVHKALNKESHRIARNGDIAERSIRERQKQKQKRNRSSTARVNASLVDGSLEVAGGARLVAERREAQVDRPVPVGARAMRWLVRQPQLDAQLDAFAALLLR